MSRGISLYLDLVRFLAALAVFLGHASGQRLTGGLLWQAASAMHTAVIVFFVLSGYVIAHVVSIREKDAWSFSASRLARLYSVVVPALVLTWLLDAIGSHIDHDFYYGYSWFEHEDVVLRYFASFFLVHEVWGANLVPGTNMPYWSIGYEAAYYLVFGLIVFLPRAQGAAAAILVLVAAGPQIALLLPTWLAGVFCYHLQSRIRLSAHWSTLLFLLSLVGMGAGWKLREAQEAGEILKAVPWPQYFEALAFSVHLLSLPRLAERLWQPLQFFQSSIRWLGGLTFSLYLFHKPLLHFFATLTPSDKTSLTSRIVVLGGTCMVVAVLGSWCEGRKGPIRRWLLQRKGRSSSPAFARWISVGEGNSSQPTISKRPIVSSTMTSEQP